jgi:hypothetical protein
VDYPHVFAVREELRSLKFLHLNPDALRQPSSIKAPSFLSSEGQNLHIPSVRLAQMVPVLTKKNHFQLRSDLEQDRAVDIYTIDIVRKYLESGFINKALSQLEQARETFGTYSQSIKKSISKQPQYV